MKKSIPILLSVFIFAGFSYAQVEPKPAVSSTWIMITRCSDSLHVLGPYQDSATNPWNLIRDKVLSNQFRAYKEENHNFQEISYSLIPENGFVIENNGDTLRPEPKSDYFITRRQSNVCIPDSDGNDSVVMTKGGLQFVYPVFEFPVDWKNIEALKVRYDKAQGINQAVYLGFTYNNATITDNVWFKIADLRKSIPLQPFLDWLNKVERLDLVGFRYMQINANNDVIKSSENNTCLNTKYRFVSIPRNEENEMLFDGTQVSGNLLYDLKRIIWEADIYRYGINFYSKDWYSNSVNYSNEYKYRNEILDKSSKDYFQFIGQSDIPWTTIDGEDSVKRNTYGELEYVYPPAEIYPFNLSDWNEIRIRESYNEKSNSFIPSGITFVIGERDIYFEYMHIDLEKLKRDYPFYEQYKWFKFLMEKDYLGINYYQISF